eukprot:1642579-Rhodomonas_salina.4
MSGRQVTVAVRVRPFLPMEIGPSGRVLCARYAMPGTKRAYRATRNPVLSERIVLPGAGESVVRMHGRRTMLVAAPLSSYACPTRCTVLAYAIPPMSSYALSTLCPVLALCPGKVPPDSGTPSIFTYDFALWSVGATDRKEKVAEQRDVYRLLGADVIDQVREYPAGNLAGTWQVPGGCDALRRGTWQVVDGFDVTVLAYGQTGSGKTYSMYGTPENAGYLRR